MGGLHGCFLLDNPKQGSFQVTSTQMPWLLPTLNGQTPLVSMFPLPTNFLLRTCDWQALTSDFEVDIGSIQAPGRRFVCECGGFLFRARCWGLAAFTTTGPASAVCVSVLALRCQLSPHALDVAQTFGSRCPVGQLCMWGGVTGFGLEDTACIRNSTRTALRLASWKDGDRVIVMDEPAAPAAHTFCQFHPSAGHSWAQSKCASRGVPSSRGQVKATTIRSISYPASPRKEGGEVCRHMLCSWRYCMLRRPA